MGSRTRNRREFEELGAPTCPWRKDGLIDIYRHALDPCCEIAFTAKAPEGMEPGSPFGPGIQALLIHLHVTQAISFESLNEIMRTAFGLDIS